MTEEYYRGEYSTQSQRLKAWNYVWGGYYFITIYTKNRKEYFGRIESAGMHLNEMGKIVRNNWLEIPCYFDNARIDEYIVMPNHLHGIIMLDDEKENNENNVETLQCNASAKHANIINSQTEMKYRF
ncbi:MAG: hypothetical protein AB7T10_06095 [bacterium]